MTEEAGPWLGPMEVENLRPGDRFSLSVELAGLHHSATVLDAYIPKADPDKVRLSIEVDRHWNGGKIPVRLGVYRDRPS
jgi:hypothetical protein